MASSIADRMRCSSSRHARLPAQPQPLSRRAWRELADGTQIVERDLEPAVGGVFQQTFAQQPMQGLAHGVRLIRSQADTSVPMIRRPGSSAPSRIASCSRS